MRPAGGEGAGDLRADSPRATRDDCYLTVKIAHCTLQVR
jgi:hypothetical protein